MAKDKKFQKKDEKDSNLEEKIIQLNRVAKVVKGGRSFSFSAMVAVGDGAGSVGLGFGKANEVPDAIKKAVEKAKKTMIKVNLKGGTIPHEITGRFGSARVFMRPASKGTGVIAGGSMRMVLESAGVHNILSKSLGSDNTINTAKATFEGLSRLLKAQDVADKRGKTLEELGIQRKVEERVEEESEEPVAAVVSGGEEQESGAENGES